MLPAPLNVSPEIARRFMRRAVLLDAPVATVGAALAHHGFIQIDPINICGRMHDLILRNRVNGYGEGDLHAHVHAPGRPGFEHYLPGQGILVAFPADAWPYLTASMLGRARRRNPWSGKLSPREARLADHILEEITARGPLTSDDIEHDGRARSAWGTNGTLTKRVLEKLFLHGRVLITARRNFRRVYDLPERVLPSTVLRTALPPAHEVAVWIALAKLRQRRLVTFKRDDLRVVADHVQPITVAGCPTLYCLRSDLGLLESVAAQRRDEAPGTVKLLAPLDPLIYDRRIAKCLWNFDYTWEVYTPAHKRVRGYYALPILSGLELVGHVDPKADRQSRRLHIVSRRVRRGHKAASAVKELGKFLGLKK